MPSDYRTLVTVSSEVEARIPANAVREAKTITEPTATLARTHHLNLTYNEFLGDLTIDLSATEREIQSVRQEVEDLRECWGSSSELADSVEWLASLLETRNRLVKISSRLPVRLPVIKCSFEYFDWLDFLEMLIDLEGKRDPPNNASTREPNSSSRFQGINLDQGNPNRDRPLSSSGIRGRSTAIRIRATLGRLRFAGSFIFEKK